MAKQYSGFKDLTPPIVEPVAKPVVEEIILQELPPENVAVDVEPVVEVEPPKFPYMLIVKYPFNDVIKGTLFSSDEDIQMVIDLKKLINCTKIHRK